jgi:glycosyltransferase involved in cell wall biosynthesis
VRLHFYQQFFTGPAAPGTLQPRNLMRVLAERGHEIHVVAADFNVYNEQAEPEENLRFEGGGCLSVHRVKSPRGLRRNLRSRLATYLSYALSARRLGSRLPKPDVVLGSIQPLFTGWVAARLARRHRAPFILEIRDLWPDALEVKGAVRGWKAGILHRLANYLYARADRVVSLTPGIKLELLKKGLPGQKIDVFTNGFDPALYQLAPGAREQIRRELGWDGQFVALYTGTHVEVTAVEVIVRAAHELKHREDIRFDLFGQGQRKAAAMQLAGELRLTNIHFHDPVPKARVPSLLAGADAALMTLFHSPLIHIYFENKLIDYMGAGIPILAAMGGQQADLIRQERTGRVVDAFDHSGLARLVAEAADQPEPFRECGRNGRRLVEHYFLLPRISERYAQMIESVAAGRCRELVPWSPLP